MQPLVLASGTQTATLTTEHTLATITIPGSYALVVDLAALVNGETLTLRRKTKVLSGGTQREEEVAVYVHAQGVPIHRFEVAPSDVEVAFTLRQDGGTGRAFPWKVLGLTGFDVLAVGTAQGGAAGNIQLAAATSFADDLVNGVIAAIIGGTGAGQQRVGYDWTSATDTLTVSPSWGTNPDATSQYVIFRAPPSPTATASLAPVNVAAINGTAVIGAGTSGDKWRA